MYSPETTKYLIHLTLQIEGVVDKPDVVGAIFGQTEGLLGEDLDLRDLQRTGRVGRIDVQITTKRGETKGEILISSSLDRAETALLASSLETIDRVGPCTARVKVDRIEDIRVTKRRKIVERAKELLLEDFDEGAINSDDLLDEVREVIRIEKLEYLGEERVHAGPNVVASDAIILVEGRADVINLLRYGIKNAVAVEGTNVPRVIIDLCSQKTATTLLDGDRGGELILRELLQVAEIDFVAYSPRGKSVEEMSRKEIVKALRNKVPVEGITDQIPNEEAMERLPPPVNHTGDEELPEQRDEENQKPPSTLSEHMAGVRDKKIARFLSPDYAVLLESSATDLEGALQTLNGDVEGLVVDRIIDQRLLDQIGGKNLEFVAARDFKGIIKRPFSIRLIKIG
ncbi:MULTISPECIES: DNA primase DnaG [unclassified Methanoculleus]|uniref:DNA primase DnaG n=1 Tax=unclassified Methanoculleus TaxID=2619537 RepID=UPI0025F40346|nr:MULTISPECIES: DNA primase DnaG [unclassified Methanoculleus]MDD2253652.1 DNA primase DnaG [Methanoculleus sp.]MDD2787905.1 DNA primase DnaG [Methanoculleus sp.]MDD3216192.1 DNA primase DnaG [Methanoculleus sp.]MDD4314139.1 DNA primase DnaG [Methanoculleus sp.]HOI57583.1 DNA primase DnaG [Methanoculleus sp.]